MPRPRTVLLVAKDHLTRNVTSAGLSKYGYEVFTAECPDAATDILRANSPVAVLVMDIDLLAAANGFGVAGLAQKTNPRIDLIYTSRTPHRAPAAAQAGNALILRDPYHPHQLADLIAMRSKTRCDAPKPGGGYVRRRRATERDAWAAFGS
jgi:DNA-binding NtrC family response regulator